MTTRPGWRLGGRLEGLVFLAMGVYGNWLVIGGQFWLFLHPKFRILLACSAAVCVALGMLCLQRPVARPHWRGMACLALTLVLALLGQQGLQPSAAFSLESLPREDVPAAMTLGGRDYLPLNAAELYLLAEQSPPDAEARFALRGMLIPDESGVGSAAVVRLQLVCCLADAVGVGFRLRGGNLPEPRGQWVRVQGRLRPLSPEDVAKGEASPVTMDGVFLLVAHARYVLEVEGVEEIDPPPMPHIVETRAAAPFAY